MLIWMNFYQKIVCHLLMVYQAAIWVTQQVSVIDQIHWDIQQAYPLVWVR